jgi:hypothetical protein
MIKHNLKSERRQQFEKGGSVLVNVPCAWSRHKVSTRSGTVRRYCYQNLRLGVGVAAKGGEEAAVVERERGGGG